MATHSRPNSDTIHVAAPHPTPAIQDAAVSALRGLVAEFAPGGDPGKGAVEGATLVRPLPPIVQAGHPALRADSAPAPQDTKSLTRFAALMLEVMHAAPGVGLAAPQLGVPLRMVVIGDSAPVTEQQRARLARTPVSDFVALNPKYEPLGPDRVVYWEACLSVPGWMALVPRHESITASWTDLAGSRHEKAMSGWPARIFQHETDHVQGVLCHDIALERSLCHADEQIRWGSNVSNFMAANAVPLRGRLRVL